MYTLTLVTNYNYVFNNSPSSNERLPDIIWCQEPFMEMLNEIEDIDN